MTCNMFTARLTTLATILLCLTIGQVGSAQETAESEATRLLRERTAEFNRGIIQVTDDVYTAVGYGVSTVSMIVGDDGLIIVDTGINVPSAEQVLEDFRAISDKPIKAVILTHSHGDHTGGLPVFARDDEPQIWARDNFGEESHVLSSVGLAINKVRGARQGGFKLPPEKRINNGIAQAYWPQRGGAVFAGEAVIQLIAPTEPDRIFLSLME